MPIEIKELQIRAVINSENGQPQNAAIATTEATKPVTEKPIKKHKKKGEI